MALRTLKAAILFSFMIKNTRTNIFVHIDGIDPNPIVIDQNELDIMDLSKNVGDLKEAVTKQLKIHDPAKLKLQFGDQELSDSEQLLADAGIAIEATIYGMIEIPLTFYERVRYLDAPPGMEVKPSFDLGVALGQDIFDALRHQKPDTVVYRPFLIDMTLNSTKWYYPTSGNTLCLHRLISFENAELLLIPEGQEPPLQRVNNSARCNDRGTFKARIGSTTILIIDSNHVHKITAPAPNGYEFFLRPKVARARRLLIRRRFN